MIRFGICSGFGLLDTEGGLDPCYSPGQLRQSAINGVQLCNDVFHVHTDHGYVVFCQVHVPFHEAFVGILFGRPVGMSIARPLLSRQ